MAVGDLTALPTGLTNLIQQGILKRKFEDALFSQMAYSMFAEKEPIEARRGATVILTRPSEKATGDQPIDPVNNTGLDNGLTPSTFTDEQYQLTMSTYMDTGDVNLLQDEAALANQAMRLAEIHGRQSQRRRERIARKRLFGAYMGGNTRVINTDVTPTTTTCQVDDVRGFLQLLVNGSLQSVTGTYTLTCQETQIPSNGRTQSLVVTGASIDSTNRSSAAAVGGQSGVLVFQTASGAPVVGDVITAPNAPQMLRPNGRLSTAQLIGSDVLTTGFVHDATVVLENNGVPRFANGDYVCILDATSSRQLFADPSFQVAYQGAFNSPEIRGGKLVRHLGVTYVMTTEAGIQAPGNGVTVTVHRPIVFGKECLIQGDWDGLENFVIQQSKNGIHAMDFVDGICMATRPPIDRGGQIVSQTWTAVFDFAVPSDLGATSASIPTASNCMFKRAVVIEHAG